ncbi:Argininosuccinate synthase [Colletotrichum fructicola]|uniref:Argininosuccinate synthase n=1 Tax=Colletotrichum fructicola (strain Nara gc5) TaxID=1213859 RepID=A0A7J6JM30_COLFN|nr:Argininosuccinate synthase [Colletotrichum fructicola]KAE9574772.1 Argininosuccinate synthase [Colletotrichum fructicola]KAF4432751.1 Argininosuccinate synthase [Colletotrichum fructicola]KAF4491033.1 Argininosuccinate synthase [Colletotrichum fructicola Nara gc5]KAF5513204.1 Argininosuccinate synthase [Colletotrichum fructicola]
MSNGKVCLAYSGGLDTSVILAWLVEQNYEVICYIADVGQEESDWASVEKKALQIGATKLIVDDLKREFVEELCWKAVQCNAVYESLYLLGTSLARPVIARGQMRAAAREGCQFVSHGCTGKGNDQVRFELTFATINPEIRCITPWRLPEFYKRFEGRIDLLDYAAEKGIPVSSTKAKPFSMDDNFAHCSYEAGVLEDPDVTPPEDMWTKTVSPLNAPDAPLDITIHFEKGTPVKVVTPQQTATDSVELFGLLNRIGGKHGVGRIDIVENRFIGLKSRGCYDSPAMTILRLAHISIEGLVLDGRVISLRNAMSQQWSELMYQGAYFSPERAFLQPSLDYSQQRVNGQVRLRLYKGSVYVLGRSSDENLYSEEDASMDSLTTFDPLDTTGFITVQAIRLKKYGMQMAEAGVKF